MLLEDVDLVHVSVPLVRPFVSALATRTTKEALLVHVRTDVGEGWGECAAEPEPTYTEEFLEGARLVLHDHLVPRLWGRRLGPDPVAALAHALHPVRGHAMARAALEMALLDAWLRAEHRSLASFLGATRERVPVGVVVEHGESAGATAANAAGRVAEGYRRIKVKVSPGQDVAVVEAVRRAVGDGVDVWADANGSYESVPDAVDALDDLGLGLLEQPLAPRDLLGHATLARRLRTPICLDESVASEDDATLAGHLGAMAVVNVKPGRVGGLLHARHIASAARAEGRSAWVGGMLETGIGRAANVALAALDDFDLPGDVSATSRYFARDLTEPFVLDGQGCLTVPSAPGLGVTVDRAAVDACTVSVHRLRRP